MAAKRPWTDEEVELLRQLVDSVGEQNATWREWSHSLFEGSRSAYSLRKKWERMRSEADSGAVTASASTDAEDDIQHYVPEFLDTKREDVPDWREIVRVAKEQQQLEHSADSTQRVATVTLRGPCVVVYSADWHMGCVATNYDAWLEHVEAVVNSDGVYMVNLSDERQNTRTFKNLATVLSQVLSPKLQAHLLESLVMDLASRGKLIASIGGNHDDEWDERIFGQALSAYIYRECPAPRFPNRGLLHLRVDYGGGEVIEYPNLLIHKSRYRSFLNASHGASREYQLSFPAKVIAGAHDHKPEIKYAWNYSLMEAEGYGVGGMSIFIKGGTFQDSEYGWKYWGQADPPIMPCVLYAKSGMLAFPHITQAVRHLRALQKG